MQGNLISRSDQHVPHFIPRLPVNLVAAYLQIRCHPGFSQVIIFFIHLHSNLSDLREQKRFY